MTQRLPRRRTVRKNLVAIDGTLDTVEGIRVEVVEKGRSPSPDHLQIRRRDGVVEYVYCHNPLCEAGGFSLGDVLRDMVRSRQTEFIGTNFCTGQEVAHPEVPDSQRSCRNRFEIQATLVYRDL